MIGIQRARERVIDNNVAEELNRGWAVEGYCRPC